jgi:hypothetical protein
MKALCLFFALLIVRPECSASTLYMNGTLHNSIPFPTGVADGSYFFSLTGSTLTYSISTRPLSLAGFDLTSGGFSLRSEAVDIPLPLLGHNLMAFSGCGLSFSAFPPYSLRHPDSSFESFPFGFTYPGDCDGFYWMSILRGSVHISPTELALFDRPDFEVSIGSLGLAGQTNPEVTTIPEPTTLTFLGLVTLSIGRRRRPTRANKITAANQLWPGSFSLKSQASTRP